jgi:hypothetical protein
VSLSGTTFILLTSLLVSTSSSEVNTINVVPDRDTVSCNRVDHKVETSSEVNTIKFVPDRDTVSCNRVDHKVETSSEVNTIKFVPYLFFFQFVIAAYKFINFVLFSFEFFVNIPGRRSTCRRKC